MKNISWLLVAIILGALVLMACGQPSPSNVTPTAKAPAAGPTTPAAAKADWQNRWETVLAAAKKEGSVSIYGQWGQRTRLLVGEAMEKNYGINLEYSPYSRGGEMLAKVEAENRAGIFMADMFTGGTSTTLGLMKPKNVLGPIRPLLILPEVLDPKAWWNDEIPFADKEGMSVAMLTGVWPRLVYNTTLVQKGEITTYKDLLKPQYKDKITISDPSESGSGNATFRHLAVNIWGEPETKDFLRRLIVDQKAVIQKDKRILIESVARGKYYVCLGPSLEPMTEFLEMKAPIRADPLPEDNDISSGTGAFAVPAKFANPNAGIVLVNWMLTKEGQTVMVETMGKPSSRLDVSTASINPDYLLKPGGKYFRSDREESMPESVRAMQVAKEVIDETNRK